MDEAKSTGPKAKWWSRPRTSAAGETATEPEAERAGTADQAAGSRSADGRAPVDGGPGARISGGVPGARAAGDATEPVGTAQAPAAAEAVRERPKPLHDPDPYGTPPYGEPGPWAPAPPVQHPGATPAQGTPVPQGGGGAPTGLGTPAQGTPVPPYAEAQSAPLPANPGNPANPGSGTPPHGTVTHPPQHHPQAQPPQDPHPQPQPQPQPHPQPSTPAPAPWQQYDPWSASRPQPLLGVDGAAPGRKPKRGRLAVAGLLLALVAGGIGGGVGAYVERNGAAGTVELPQAGPESKERPPGSVAGIAASALPGVVTLHVSGADEAGTGTGFVLDARGHILTNNHVVQPAGDGGDVTVTFSGGETAKGEVVGGDAGYDLAVVKVDGVSGLKPLRLGNSENVQVGDPVVAIGAPFDLSNTVTAGIISAKERPITAGGEEGDGSDVSYVDALQTDAPINPGNSGGPLVDSKARVIGINSAIRSAGSGSGLDGGQAGSIGLGFAIPINQAKRVAEELINTGKATHPVIEVTLDTKFTGDGARVAEKAGDGSPAVRPGGPADKAGIEAGDVITQVDGQRVHSGEELIVKIRAHRPGDRLKLTLERGGKERTLSLVLGTAASS
ncbi:trypsin-like peptidase domain-containing protein [Streptomyces sp. NPDC002851]